MRFSKFSFPYGRKEFWRMVMKPALNNNFMEQICSSGNVREAWKRVKSNDGKPGVDRMDMLKFLEYSKENWEKIRKSLQNGSYKPSPVLRVEIPKKTGGKRPLGIPTVCDRLIQQSTLQILNPIFDPLFSEASFGFRPQRSAHGAIDRVKELVNEGYHWVVDIDISKFFDNVNHDILMNLVGKIIRDKVLLKLIGKYLRSGVSIDGTVHPTLIGTPQGGPLSPLLANIYLDVLDRELEKRGLNFVRYADDALIFVKSKPAGVRVMQSVTNFLSKKLKLTVNESKSAVRKFTDTNYLGFRFCQTTKGVKISWTDKALSDFKYNLKRYTGRSWFVSMDYRLTKLTRYVRGWMQYFGKSEFYGPIPILDSWLRRRVRMCYLKQWRFKRTRMNRYIQLGVTFRTAKRSVFIERSWWYLASILATQNAMTNKWLAEQGVPSVKDIWCKIHYPDDPRDGIQMKLSFTD